MTELEIYLHSTIFILKPIPITKKKSKFPYLHSTIFILKLPESSTNDITEKFTFYNIYIKTITFYVIILHALHIYILQYLY